jgi:hypothetical protein
MVNAGACCSLMLWTGKRISGYKRERQEKSSDLFHLSAWISGHGHVYIIARNKTSRMLLI